MVEEISYVLSNGKLLVMRKRPHAVLHNFFSFSASVCGDICSPIPVALHRVQLSKELYGVDRITWGYVLIPVLRLLQSQVHRQQKGCE